MPVIPDVRGCPLLYPPRVNPGDDLMRVSEVIGQLASVAQGWYVWLRVSVTREDDCCFDDVQKLVDNFIEAAFELQVIADRTKH